MNSAMRVRLLGSELAEISSPYLSGGRKQESWQIDEVDIQDSRQTATVSMRSICPSATDAGGFHLSFITALEFISQLQIIYMHVSAGLQQKKQEAWMVECKVRSLRPIRNPSKMKVETDVEVMRKRGQAYYCVANHRLTDDQDGNLEVWIKALMS